MHTATPLTSLIIPIYNAEQYLRRCLDSVVKQSFSDFECILVDDGSTDGSKAICEDFCAEDERFILISQVNSGVSEARNAGMRHAKGKYIVFADSDDELKTDYLKNLIFAPSEYDIVISGLQYYNSANNSVRIRKFQSRRLDFLNDEGFSLILETKGHELCVSKRFRNALIKKHNIAFLNGLNLGEDTCFTCTYITHCKNCKLCDCVDYIYYTGDHNSLSSFSRCTFRKQICAHVRLETVIKQRFPQAINSPAWQRGEFNLFYSAIFDTLNQAELSTFDKHDTLNEIINVDGYNSFIQNFSKYATDGIAIQLALSAKSSFLLLIVYYLYKLLVPLSTPQVKQ